MMEFKRHNNRLSFEQFSDANIVEKHSGEYSKLTFGSFQSGITVELQTSYTYESGRSATHHTDINMTADELRYLAKELVSLADMQDRRDAA